ncbi:MAG: substrate-binding domain-containing protein, partial [Planctomycetota bacterium]
MLCTALAVLSAGCQPTASSSNGSADAEGTLTIAVIPKGTTHIFWKSVHYGAEQAAKEVNASIQWRGPAREDNRDEQISVVQSFLNKQVDGICLAPLDADALVSPVAEARRGKVPVVIFDSGLADSTDTVSYVATDNFLGGTMAAKAMAESMNFSGNVVVLRYSKGSESTFQREEGFLEAIKEFPKINVLSSDQYAGTTAESAIDKAQQVFNK